MPWFYAGQMQSRSNRGWRPPRWWELKLKDWSARQITRLDPSPKAGLSGSQTVLRHTLRKAGPDSPRTANAMVQVADQLKRQERYGEELLLREQVVQALRKNLGEDHENTLSAESQMGMCLVSLDREEDAEPLLARVVAESDASPCSVSPEAIEAMVWLAVIYMRSGRLDESRHLLERVLPEYALHGAAESTAAMRTSTILAAGLVRLHGLEEAIRLYRHILDVRARTVGVDDPETLDTLESLARVLIRADQLAEARVLAMSLLEQRTRVLGAEHSDTSGARKLLTSIEPPPG